MRGVSLVIAVLAVIGSEAFAPIGTTKKRSSRTNTSSSSMELSMLWKHWIPEESKVDFLRDEAPNDSNREIQHQMLQTASNFFLASLLTIVLVPATSVLAVSGGGLDYAGLDISGQDFSNGNYKGKDFTQVIAKGTNFAKSNLQGCRFYKSYLVNVDFSGSDITGASLEGTSMDGASLKDTVAKGTYFSKSILDTETVENADFTDAQFPPKVQPILCEREDMKGINPTTGADTRESAMCL